MYTAGRTYDCSSFLFFVYFIEFIGCMYVCMYYICVCLCMCMCVFIQLYNKMPQFDLRVPLKVYLKKKKKRLKAIIIS